MDILDLIDVFAYCLSFGLEDEVLLESKDNLVLSDDIFNIFVNTKELLDSYLQMNSVESSNVNEINYDSKRNDLLVKFKGGSVYRYFNVPEQKYEKMLNVESKGRYLNAEIKGVFDYQKIF